LAYPRTSGSLSRRLLVVGPARLHASSNAGIRSALLTRLRLEVLGPLSAVVSREGMRSQIAR
jgi:hypothetical protein